MGQTLKTERVDRAIGAAKRRKRHVVVEPARAELSPLGRDVLTAHHQLSTAGLIESADYGKVDLAMPSLRVNLRAN